ncbi:MAG TPA: class I adenylate-forming enzyme family protein [Candidatus Dormibacteraeota bacterium]|nr:class I adenylate-forming enzyme family protein [Candidatus Dormibacteraeota bacterium]
MTAPSLLHELLDDAATRWPDRTAVRCGDELLTYRSLWEISHRLAGWLADAGVRRGDRVVVALPAAVLLPALLYACSRVGGVFVVLREQLPVPVLAHVLDDAEPALLISDVAHAQGLAGERGIGHRGFEAVRAAALTAPGAAAPPGPLSVDPVSLIYTSGSTGMPKAVVSLHTQVLFATRAIQSMLRYQPQDVVYCALPIAFDYGLYQIFLCTLAGSELHLADPERVGQGLLLDLCRAAATVLPAVPTLAAGLARLLPRSTAARPPLRLLTNTGAAMPLQALRELRAQLPELRVQLMFGLTECKRVAIMNEDEDLRRPGACGRALPGTEILVVDDGGAPLAPGEVGELVVRGPNVMAGYWRRPELTGQRFERTEGLFPRLRTGDYGWLDDDGYLHFVGRRDDIYKERGSRVSTIEVEAAANRVSGVEAAAVLPPTGDEPGATLLVVTTLTPREVLNGLLNHLEDVKVPRCCVVVPQLPINANGKVDRRRLAALAGARRD